MASKRKVSSIREADSSGVNHYQVDIYWSPEDKVFVAKVPELPGCMTHGNTRAEAAVNADQAITLYIQTLTDRHLKVPVPLSEKRFSGKFPVRTEPELHRDLTAKAQMENKSLNEYVVSLLKKRA